MVLIEERIIQFENNINFTHDYFVDLSPDELVDLIEKNSQFPDMIEWIYYFIWLFRREDKIDLLLNSKIIPTSLLIRYIYFSLGKWISKGRDPDFFFLEISESFKKEQSLRLLIDEKLVDLDVNLALALISNLDEEYFNAFVYTSEAKNDVTEFMLDLFEQLEEDMLKAFFKKNLELYSFILTILKNRNVDADKLHNRLSKFLNKFKQDLETLNSITKIKDFVRKNYDFETEAKKNISQRVFSRISYIINELHKLPNIDDNILLLYRNKVIIDRYEKDLILQIVNDEHMGRLFLKSEPFKV